MQERVFKRKVLDANILKEMHVNNVCYSKHSKDRFIPFRFDKFGCVITLLNLMVLVAVMVALVLPFKIM